MDMKAGEVISIRALKPFGQTVPQGRVYMRQCYIDLFPKIMKLLCKEGQVTVTLTGTPGIGKSVFGLLVVVEIIRMLLDAKASCEAPAKFGGLIVYEHVNCVEGPATYYLIDTDNRKIELMHKSMPPIELQNPRTLLVKDGPCKTYDVQCSVFWVSSPRDGAFQKVVFEGEQRYVVPPWTTDELVDCWKKECCPEDLFTLEDDRAKLARMAKDDTLSVLEDGLPEVEKYEAVVRRWAADLGPVARRVFNPAKSYNFSQNALNNDLSKEDLQKVAEMAESKDAPGESSRFKTSHWLLLMDPSPDFTTFEFIPASMKIATMILYKRFQLDISAAQKLMGKMSGTHLGLVFEPFAHFTMSRGGSFIIRNLATGEESKLELSERSKQEIGNDQLESKTFYIL